MDKNKIQSIILLLLLSLIWGSSFILIKKGLIVFSPVQVGSLRIFISGLVFLPYVLLKIMKVEKRVILYIIFFAALEVGIPPFLYSFAQTKLDSGTAGILNSLVPLFTLITGFLFFQLKFNYAKIFGVLIGLSGAVLLTFSHSANGEINFDFSNIYGLLIVFATCLYGFGGNVLQKYLSNVSGVLISSIAFVSMSIPAGFLLAYTKVYNHNFSDPQTLYSFSAIAVLSLVGSALAIYLFSLLTRKSNALFASFVTYLMPFVALMWGYVDNEKLNFVQFLSLLLILLGIYFSHKNRLKMKRKL